MNNSNAGACTETCRLATCGDSLIREGVEDCDGANLGDLECSTIGEGPGVLVCSESCESDICECILEG